MSFLIAALPAPLETAIPSSNMPTKPVPAKSRPLITRHPCDGSLDRMSDAVGVSAASRHRLDWERSARLAATESAFRRVLSDLKQQVAWKASGRQPSDEEDNVAYAAKAG